MPEINITPKSSPSPETTVMYEDTTTSFNSYDSAAEISVTIADEKVPIVVFFGAPQCGKTMALVRLARYLKKQNYIKAIENYNIAINNYKDNSPEIFYERGLL